MRKKICIFSLLLLFFFLPFLNKVNAQSMSNDNYSIQGYPGTPLDRLPTPTDTPDVKGTNTGPGSYSGSNFTLINDASTNDSSISFAVSEPLIDFGVLSATNPVIRKNQLQAAATKNGYQVLESEDHPLEIPSNDTIENITCDNGSCSDITAAIWSSTLTYGFGYRCNGDACSKQFTTDNYYEQFSDSLKDKNDQPVMTNSVANQNNQVEITYKVNISGTQATGRYSNTITYLAVPNF